jgi:hypothetical protein
VSVVVLILILIGGYIAVKIYLPRFLNRGINVAGDALGKALTTRAPTKAPPSSQEWAVTLTRPVAEVRTQLASAGLADDRGRVQTPSGLLVELYGVPGSPGLACSWDPASAQKPTAIMADVLRIVRQVDPDAQVVL